MARDMNVFVSETAKPTHIVSAEGEFVTLAFAELNVTIRAYIEKFRQGLCRASNRSAGYI